jgi:DNA-binding FadR family transcriptional regulator
VDDAERYLQADVDFHVALIEAAHNRMLTGLREAVRSALVVRHGHVGRHLADMAQSLPLHDAICEAVFAGDARGASAASVELLEQVQRDDHAVLSRRPEPSV